MLWAAVAGGQDRKMVGRGKGCKQGLVPGPHLTWRWSGRPTSQAFFGFFGIVAGGPPLTFGVDMTSDVKSKPPMFLHFFHLG